MESVLAGAMLDGMAVESALLKASLTVVATFPQTLSSKHSAISSLKPCAHPLASSPAPATTLHAFWLL
jgi:hypothetical protein